VVIGRESGRNWRKYDKFLWQ